MLAPASIATVLTAVVLTVLTAVVLVLTALASVASAATTIHGGRGAVGMRGRDASTGIALQEGVRLTHRGGS